MSSPRDDKVMGSVAESELARLRSELQAQIRERQQLEAALRLSEEKARLVLHVMIDASPVPCALNDEQRTITYVNPAFTRTFGYTLDDVPTLAEWWPKAYPDAAYRRWVTETWQVRLEDAKREGAPFEPLEVRIHCKDGIQRTAIVGATALAGSFAGVHLVTLFDITARQRMEASLRESEARYARVVAGVNDAIWDWDVANRLVYFSPRWAEMRGLTLHEQSDREEEWIADIHPEDAPRVMTRLRSHFAGESEVFSDEYRVRCKDGSWKWILDRGTAERDASGTVVRMAGAKRDITAAKEGEAERRALEAQLSQAQKMEAVGTLAGGIAHDFNNILAVILGNLTLAQHDVGPDHPATESLEQIHGGVDRAVALVQQILAFSRPQSIEKRVMKLRASIEEDTRLLRATLPAGVELITHFNGNAPDIVCHPNAIRQVLVNLCTNAWHAMEGHPGRISLILDEVTVRAGSTGDSGVVRPGRYARLTVTDTGKGMDAETLGRIFEPFFTTKQVGQGTGLGLAIVHGIMTNLGGAITAASEQGLGTTFELFFPAAPAEHQNEHVDVTPAGVPRGRGQHILFLDDEQALVNLGVRILERHGFRVTGLTSADEALAAIQRNPGSFDLVVTDHYMPRVSGVHLAREIGTLRPDLPVMLASGLVTDALEAEATAAGVRYLLDKPYSAIDLCTLVHRALHPSDSPIR